MCVNEEWNLQPRQPKKANNHVGLFYHIKLDKLKYTAWKITMFLLELFHMNAKHLIPSNLLFCLLCNFPSEIVECGMNTSDTMVLGM